MAPDSSKAGRVVFVGNIPYGLTEEQIVHVFSQVGQVVNFRLVYDRDTGRPKGFGFAEYADPDAAASAVRNLNDYETMGRKLRVDFSHEGGDDDNAAPANYTVQPPQPPLNGAAVVPPTGGSSLPPLPPGTDLPPNLTCPDAISRTLSTLPAPQFLDILSQMKGLVMSDPNKATELLRQAPQLSYAIFQALLLMGLVDTSVLTSVVEQATTNTPQPPVQAQAQFGGAYGMPTGTPPVHHTPYAPPPPPVQQAPPPAAAQPDQAALLQQVLSLTQQQIDAMPPVERSQIMLLRQQLMGGASFG